MELIKKIISESSIYEEKVESISDPGTFHNVRLLIDGIFQCCDRVCHCKFKKEECRHIQGIKKKLEEKEGWRWNLK